MSLPILFFSSFAFFGLIHSLIFSILSIKNRRTDEMIITLFLFSQSLVILEYVFYWTGLEKEYPYLCNISLPLQLLFGPLLFIYIDYVFLENKRSRKYFFHFIPAIVLSLLMLPFYFSTAELKLNHYKMIDYFILNLRGVVYFIIVQMSVYCIFLISKITREKRVGYINNWLKIIVGAFAFYILCYFSYYIMVNQPWFTLNTDYFVSTGMCVSIISIIYLTYGKNTVLNGMQIKESVNPASIYFTYNSNPAFYHQGKKKEETLTYSFPVEISNLNRGETIVSEQKIITDTSPQGIVKVAPFEKYKNSGLTVDAANELAEALNQLMQKEKLYRESDLKLETLAVKLGYARHNISQVINQHLGVNYFEYINLLRIQEAKRLLDTSEKNEMNIIDVAYAVGYSTKNTFNSAFRRIEGVTPGEYRKQSRIKKN